MSASVAFCMLQWCIFQLARKGNHRGIPWVGLTTLLVVLLALLKLDPMICVLLGALLSLSVLLLSRRTRSSSFSA